MGESKRSFWGIPGYEGLTWNSYPLLNGSDTMGLVESKPIVNQFKKPIFLRRSILCWLWLVSSFLFVACDEIGNPLAAPTTTPPPPTETPEPTLTPIPDPNTAAGFDDFLAQAEGSRVSNRQALANRYLAQLTKAPVTTENRAIFLWQGVAQTVQLAGDMNNWNLADAPSLIRLEGTDLWYLAAEFEPEARLDYKFVLNGSDWRLDPLNPQTMRGGFGPNSELAMPGYIPPLELQPAAQEIPAGTLETHTINSRHLNQTRTFFVYRPPGQLVGEKLPSVYFHDGSDYLNIIDAPALLDRLIAGRQIPPLVAVFIPPINRNQDYNRNEAYVQFLSDELVPFIQANFATDPAPEKTATLGASLGGLAAIYTAASRPDVFGLAAGQSGAYSLDEDAVLRQIAGQGAEISGVPGLRFYLVVGSYETAVSGNSQEGDLLAANRRLVNVLEDKGYDYLYKELPQGHSWGLWQATIGQALAYLLG